MEKKKFDQAFIDNCLLEMDKGRTASEVAKEFNVGFSTLCGWKRKRRLNLGGDKYRQPKKTKQPTFFSIPVPEAAPIQTPMKVVVVTGSPSEIGSFVREIFKS